MAIAFVAAATQTDDGATTLVINKPPGTVEGHVMVAVLAVSTDSTVTPPAGWTEVVNTLVDTNQMRQAVYWKAAGGSEPSTYTFTLSRAKSSVGVISTYSGVDTVAPIDVSSASAETDQLTTITAPSVTTTGDNDWVIVASGVGRETTVTTPSGTTSRGFAGDTNNVDVSLRLSDFTQPVAGATGDKTATVGAFGPVCGQQVAILVGNDPPNAPTIDAPGDGTDAAVTASLTVDWTFDDPDAGDTQSAYALSRTIATVTTYWRASDSTWQPTEVKNTATSTAVALPVGWGAAGDVVGFEVKTWDVSDVSGPYSLAVTVTAVGTIKFWDGAEFVTAPIRVYDGTSFQLALLKRWDGAQWTNA